MPSNSGTYDEALLGSAPKPNREQLQEGYDPKLLENANRPKTVTPTPTQEKLRPVTAPPPIDSDPELAGAKPREIKPVPFWRTKKGRIIIGAIVLAAIIIAAVVGGVVGSRNSKKDPTQIASPSPSNTPTPSSGGGDTVGTGNNSGGDQQNPAASSQPPTGISGLLPAPTNGGGTDGGNNGNNGVVSGNPQPTSSLDALALGDVNIVDSGSLGAIAAAFPAI